jgi:hypothetical protein
MSQEAVISGGSFQDSLGNPLALGTVIVELSQDVNIGVQLCAGLQSTLNLDASGSVTGGPTLWGPVTYHMSAYSAKGQKVWRGVVVVPDAPTFSLTP